VLEGEQGVISYAGYVAPGRVNAEHAAFVPGFPHGEAA
jgi:hypothetical protein